MKELLARFSDAVQKHTAVTTMPVAVKIVRNGESRPQKFREPLKDHGGKMAVCQAMTAVRTIGWSFAVGEKDHACPFPSIFLGHLDPAKFLDGTAAGFYQEDIELGRTMEASYPRWPMGTVNEVWLAQAARAEFEPDLAVVYGMPAQILILIQAANYGNAKGIKSSSHGRLGCSTWLAGVIQSGECTYMVPGPGERVFGGTQDHEMSFAVPAPKIEKLIEGLEYVRKTGAFRYPVPNLQILNEPKLPPKYEALK